MEEATINKQAKNKRSCDKKKLKTALSVILLIIPLVVAFFTVFFFAVPTVEIGGKTEYGKTQTIFGFLFGGEPSLVDQIIDAFDTLSEEELVAENTMEYFGVIMKLFRLGFLLIPTLIVLVKTIVNVILTIYYFRKKNPSKQGCVAVDSVAKNLLIYVSFVFFGSVSGGIGNNSYYVGYTVGTGMTIGMFIGLALIITTAILNYKLNKDNVTDKYEKFDKWMRAFTTGIGYICIAVVLTFIRLYSVFMYVLNSCLTVLAMNAQTITFSSVLFLLLNLSIFVACEFINGRATKGFSCSFQYLLMYGDRDEILGFKSEQKVSTRATKSFIPVIVFSLISVGAVFLLRNPKYGYGWSVNIYYPLVCIFAIATVSQFVASFWKDRQVRKLLPIGKSTNYDALGWGEAN